MKGETTSDLIRKALDEYVAKSGFTLTDETKDAEEEGLPPLEPVVSLVAPDAVDSVIGARDRNERIRFLQQLRDEERIFCDKGRLTQSLARGSQGLSRAYCFRCPASQIPKVPRQTRSAAKPESAAIEASSGQAKRRPARCT